MEEASYITTDTMLNEQKLQSDPTTVPMTFKTSCDQDKSNLTTEDEALPHFTLKEGTYSTDLFQAFPKVCQKAKSGVQYCQAVSAFVTERAGLESNYAQALLKLAQGAKAEDWSQQFSRCWATFQEAFEHLAHERWTFAQTMQTTIGPRAKAFAAQQEIQTQRLVSEGTKVRWARQQMISSVDKAREKYERKCNEAIEITSTIRKSETSTGADVSVASSDVSDEVSMSKELTDKLAAGAGQLLTKMWDTTSSFGRNPLERQRSKLYGCLDEVMAAEKHYVHTVEYANAQRPVIDREIKDNLLAFQLTEEQRLEYLRDILLRMQKAFIDMFSRSQQFVERMKTSVNEVHELADIEKGFQGLGSQEDVDVDRADLSVNPFYIRMTHIQAMSDNGQRMVGTINSIVTEFIASETRFVQSLRKLLRTHESGGLILATDLFGASFNATSFLADEGSTMANGWMILKDQVKLLLEIHQEFRSLLAEPVSLSLATMKSEYERARIATQENFVKLHTALCNEAALHKKLQQKLNIRSRDFAMMFSYLPGATPVTTNSYGIDISEALKVLNANIRLFNEKERRSEAKLRQLADEMCLLQVQVTDSSTSLKQTYQIYIQEIEVFISTCMKNEKYRLQVSKNSLQSLAKAVEHMLQGGMFVGNKALTDFEKIDPSSDMAEFVQANRQPYEPAKLIVPVYHNNDNLKEVIKEYLGNASLVASENSDKTIRRLSSGANPSTTTPSNEIHLSETKLPHLSESSEVKRVAIASEIAEEDTTVTGYADANLVKDPVRGSYEAQPPGDSDLEKKIQSDTPDQVVESYTCALYFSNFPFHGRLYLTKDRMHFSGWRDTLFTASFSEIAAMEKKNTALIVPNAIEFTVRGEKVFFASFVFRDECYQSIQQLRSMKKETEVLMLDPTPESLDLDRKLFNDGELIRKSSSHDLAAVAPIPKKASAETTSVEGSRLPLSVSSTLAAHPVIPEKDDFLDEFDLLLNEEVPFSVDTAFTRFWIESNTFSREILDAAGATNISLPDWTKQSVAYAAVTKLDTFDGSRLVSYVHNKKYMIGPSVIPTAQIQRYSYRKGNRLIVSTTTSVSDVPYCDYFRVEHRWVFSAMNKPSESLAQVGLRIQWLKSTWLKKQIENTTVSEAKEAVKAWLDAALDATKTTKLNDQDKTSTRVVNSLETTSKSISVQKVPSNPLFQQVATVTSSSTAANGSQNGGSRSQFHPSVQAAVIACALMLIYAIYFRQQQELLEQLLERLKTSRT
ncbi:putative membrane-anchored lipid-binding protein Ysp2/Lam4 [Plasmopara halstedii]